ncbi:methylornithine synthase PylB [Thermincola potens]|uniref:Radical SAM domain protein n=1 Tax=Thermincola potens (strain JR) TaxID=635013 RepID=D5X8E0_THEPJ|nr:methylornithine synthase PylB [Thermincola potens]ADG80919.1 Radical SAM domain protein [Thermincola potens JR]
MVRGATDQRLDDILNKALKETPLTKEDLIYLLSLTDPAGINLVFQTARTLRERYFGNKVFLYGFVYFSTYCRNNCAFCMYRRSNRNFKRYRKTEAEILDTANRLVESGVHLLDLTMGEDPAYFSNNCEGFEKLIRTVENIKKATEMPLMISPGVVSEEILREFKKIGVDWYACYQETHNLDLFNNLRLDQSYDTRMEKKIFAHKVGLLIEEGIMTGVGDTAEDIAHSLEVMNEIGAEQVRVMSFVSQEWTPMYPWPVVPRLRELLIIAVMRLCFPNRLIPASLDVDGLSGLRQRLNAGANIVTSIIPPGAGLAGVSQSSLDIEEGKRTVSSIIPVLEECNLTTASRDDYSAWVTDKQNGIFAW